MSKAKRNILLIFFSSSKLYNIMYEDFILYKSLPSSKKQKKSQLIYQNR